MMHFTIMSYSGGVILPPQEFRVILPPQKFRVLIPSATLICTKHYRTVLLDVHRRNSFETGCFGLQHVYSSFNYVIIAYKYFITLRQVLHQQRVQLNAAAAVIEKQGMDPPRPHPANLDDWETLI